MAKMRSTARQQAPAARAPVTGRIHVEPANADFENAGIYIDDKLVLTTAIDANDPRQHNEVAARVAEMLRREVRP